MQENKAPKLVEKVVGIFENEKPLGGTERLLAAIEQINHRLDRIEEAIASPAVATHDPLVGHPSQEKFTIMEAAEAAPGDQTTEKACTFEPNGRPCDHCSMCSARGF